MELPGLAWRLFLTQRLLARAIPLSARARHDAHRHGDLGETRSRKYAATAAANAGAGSAGDRDQLLRAGSFVAVLTGSPLELSPGALGDSASALGPGPGGGGRGHVDSGVQRDRRAG